MQQLLKVRQQVHESMRLHSNAQAQACTLKYHNFLTLLVSKEKSSKETKIDDQPPQAKEEVKIKPEIQIDEETEKMWKNLNTKADNMSRTFFEYLTINQQYTENGTSYDYHKITRSEQQQLYDLLKESAALDKADDFMKYSENIKKRALLLIEGMTPEQDRKSTRLNSSH